MSLLLRSTINLVQTYHRHSSSFLYVTPLKDAGKILTKPSEGVSNNRRDNANGDYIFKVGDIIHASEQVGSIRSNHYVVECLLGAGSFGQVFRCVCQESHQTFAVKVIKNLPAYTRQAALEKAILENLLQADPDDKFYMLRLTEQFIFEGHYCFVTEMLGIDLYSVLKQNRFRGFSLNLLRRVLTQILKCLCLLRMIGLIHSDLKPENILLDHCLPHIKVIDFGSAAYEKKTVFNYIQSRYYRSPEVLLGLPYNCAIDMWSVGCIAAELYIGHPLFPGCSEHDQIYRITHMLGPFPPELVRNGRNFRKFYSSDPRAKNGYSFVSFEEYVRRTNINKPPKQYGYIADTLEDTIANHQMKYSKDGKNRINEPEFQCYIHFIKMCLEYDATKRLTPMQALNHPFIRGLPFDPQWTPQPEPAERTIISPVDAGNNTYNILRMISPTPSPSPAPSSTHSTSSLMTEGVTNSSSLTGTNFHPFAQPPRTDKFDGVHAQATIGDNSLRIGSHSSTHRSNLSLSSSSTFPAGFLPQSSQPQQALYNATSTSLFTSQPPPYQQFFQGMQPSQPMQYQNPPNSARFSQLQQYQQIQPNMTDSSYQPPSNLPINTGTENTLYSSSSSSINHTAGWKDAPINSLPSSSSSISSSGSSTASAPKPPSYPLTGADGIL